jgi:acetyl-CoA carboxylase biotin carboxyl carrier protein
VTERDEEPATAELLALVDRLGVMLDENDLAELEIESEGTRVLLRRATAQAPIVYASAPAGGAAAPHPTAAGGGPSYVAPSTAVGGPHADAAEELAGAATGGGPAPVAVISPLTGIFYASPAPGSAPYVQVGGEVAVGQVIGLVEAMKLFNEIKSHVAGRVVRIAAETGALIKAKQALIEVEPL